MAGAGMQTVLAVAWIDRVVLASTTAFVHAIASLSDVFGLVSASISQSSFRVLLTVFTLAGFMLAGVAVGSCYLPASKGE